MSLDPRLLAIVLCALAFNCPANTVAQDADSVHPAQTSSQDAATQPAAAEELPDSPGTTWARSQTPDQSREGTPSASTQPITEPPDKPDKKEGEKLQRPVGTAAAEAPKVSGVTAAQPAGAAIAPAKQHRVRTIVVRVGAILGASAAVGMVVALSAATPSKPPGAH